MTPIAEKIEIKGISLIQPWASLVVLGAKRMETRSWPTSYRGWVAIHASSRYPRDCRLLAQTVAFQAGLKGAAIPTGGLVGMAYLEAVVRSEKARRYLECTPTERNRLEKQYGDYSDRRWAFCFTRSFQIPFLQCKGALKFFDLAQPVTDSLRLELSNFLSLDTNQKSLFMDSPTIISEGASCKSC